MTAICDFCSGPSPTVRYHTHPFGLTTPDQVFGDTPVYNIDGLNHVATEDLHPDYGIGAMMSPEWLACEACSRWIDARDLTGLLSHCLTQFRTAGLLADPCLNDEMTTAYHQLFRAFFHYLQYCEPWPPSA
ncbi:MAG: hypothetical protein ABL970_02075 [Nitrospira sp.]